MSHPWFKAAPAAPRVGASAFLCLGRPGRRAPTPHAEDPLINPLTCERRGYGFTPQVPAHRAVERDEGAVADCRATTWQKIRG